MVCVLVGSWAPRSAHGQTPSEAQRRQPATKLNYRGYTLRYKKAEAVRQMLTELLANVSSDTRVVIDKKTNQLIVHGPEHIHALVERLLDDVDRPPRAPAPEAKQPVLKAYACRPAQLAATADRLRATYRDDRQVSVATNGSTGQLFILAPPARQVEISAWLADAAVGPIGRTGGSEAAVGDQQTSYLLPLKHASVMRVDRLLHDAFGSRLRRTGRIVPEHGTYQLAGAKDQRLDLMLDRQGNTVTLTGPKRLAQQAKRLIETIDRPVSTGETVLKVVPLGNADPQKIEEAARALRAHRRGGRPHRLGGDRPGSPAASQGHPVSQLNRIDPPSLQPVGTAPRWAQRAGHVADLPAPDRVNHRGAAIVEGEIPQVSYLFQDADTAEGGGPEDDREGPDGNAREPRGQPPHALGSDVEIDTLPDLDVLILRGSEKDVAELMRIIEEIERISVENEPVIEVVRLHHVKDEALVKLLLAVQKQLSGKRQGRVQITPLVRPNALLLIGWGEAMDAARRLIRKLDQPAERDGQLHVLPLRHVAAASAAKTIVGLFSQTTGLGTRVTVTPDTRSNALLVQAAPRDLAAVKTLLEQIDTPGSDAVNKVRVFDLHNSLATDLAKTLQAAIQAASGRGAQAKSAALELLTIDNAEAKIINSGVLEEVHFTADPQRNALIVTAPAKSMELVAALIHRLDDKPAAIAQIKVFRIVNADANDLVTMLRGLLPEKTRAAVGPQLPGAEGETSTAPLRLAVDIRTNSIIATGAAGDLRIIEALLIRLDQREAHNRETSVYRLKNAPALDVANAVNDFLRSKRVVEEVAPPRALSPFRQIEREVVVVPELVSNSLIISATPRYYKDVIALVEDLDAQPAQVMIQVLIAQVALNDADEFGVELGLQDSLLFDRGLLSDLLTTVNTVQTSTPAGILTNTQQIIQGATNTPGFNFNNQPLGNSGSNRSLATSSRVGGQALSSFNVGRTNSELGFGGLVLSASSESVSVLIRALQETRRLEVLSRPQVMTLDNQPAFIQVGQRVPRIIGTQINQVGQVNTVALENVGLILGVTPRISPTGMVVMEIDAERSEVGPEQEGIPISISATGEVIRSPRIDTTTAQTTVSAADGETIVLGGLITKRKNIVHRRVPYLNEIPLLGHLFRYDLKTERRFELLIIMTPHVIRTSEDAQRLRHVEQSRVSWAAGDVEEIHGRGHVCGKDGCPYCEADVPVIHPDENPQGILPETLPPQPADDLPAPTGDSPSVDPRPPVEKTSYDQPATEPLPARKRPNGHATDSRQSRVRRLPSVETSPTASPPAARGEPRPPTHVSQQATAPAKSTRPRPFPRGLFSLFKKKSPSTHR